MKVKAINNDEYYMAGLNLNKKKTKTIAFAWAKKKGDWWYENDPSNAKLFDIRKSKLKDGVARYGIYIGRLALVYMTKGVSK